MYKRSMRRLVSYDIIRTFNDMLKGRFCSIKMFVKVDDLYLRIERISLPKNEENGLVLHCSAYPEKMDVLVDVHKKIELFFA